MIKYPRLDEVWFRAYESMVLGDSIVTFLADTPVSATSVAQSKLGRWT